MPEDYKGDDVVNYLGGTALEQLFSAQIPIVIPQEAYFEGQWILAPPGAGKTQFIQSQIVDLLDKNVSIIVMDSQEQLINNIQGLSALRDRLVVIDANDIEFPVALNIFDLGMGEDISPLEKERTLNAALELTMFLLDSLLGSDLTGKQAVVFRFIMQAIFAIPNATIYTLEELLSTSGSTKYKQYLDTLDGAAKRFFETEFDDKEFVKTEKEIIRRLYGILGIKQWERMFNNPRSKFV